MKRKEANLDEALTVLLAVFSLQDVSLYYHATK